MPQAFLESDPGKETALARGATMAGTATCSGEGGMIPDERRYSSKWFYQCIQSRYGFNPNHLVLADGCEFFIGQGCKVGLGGHLMGQKVTVVLGRVRVGEIEGRDLGVNGGGQRGDVLLEKRGGRGRD